MKNTVQRDLLCMHLLFAQMAIAGCDSGSPPSNTASVPPIPTYCFQNTWSSVDRNAASDYLDAFELCLLSGGGGNWESKRDELRQCLRLGAEARRCEWDMGRLSGLLDRFTAREANECFREIAELAREDVVTMEAAAILGVRLLDDKVAASRYRDLIRPNALGYIAILATRCEEACTDSLRRTEMQQFHARVRAVLRGD